MADDLAQSAKPGLLITTTVLLISSLTIMANATIAPSLPGLVKHFEGTPNIETLAGLILSLPSLAVILTATLAGMLVDRVDRRIFLLIAMLLYAAGGVLGAFAETIPQILVGRIILGVGVAGTMTMATVLAADFWQGPARVQFMGRQGAATGVGGMLFMLVGGALAIISWRGPFLVYLLAVPLAVMAYSVLPASLRADKSQGQTVQTDPTPWSHILTVCSFACFSMLMFYVVPTRIPFLLRDIGETSPLVAGVVMAAMTLSAIPVSLSYGKARAYAGPLVIAAISFGFMAAGFGIVSIASNLVGVMIGIVVSGIGMGFLIPNSMAWLMSQTPDTQRGKASGLLTMALFAGQFVSPLVGGAFAAPAGFGFSNAGVFAAFAMMLLVASVLTLVFRSSRRPAPIA